MGRLYVAYDRWLERLYRGEEGWNHDRTSPAPRLQCVLGDGRRPERVFVGSFEDGLHRSRDGGATFERVGADGIGSDAVTSMAIHPSDPEVLYAGTEPSHLYRSTDGGDTWSHLPGLRDVPSEGEWAFPPRPHTDHVRCLAIDPNDPDRLYIGIEAGATIVSPDGGETFVDRPAGSRRDPHWLATHEAATGRVYLAAGDGYAQSEDAGETWTHPQDGLQHRYVWGLAPDAVDPDRVLVSSAQSAHYAHHGDPPEAYVYRRTDGEPWERLDHTELPMGEGVYRHVVAAGEVGGEWFAGTTRGIYRTTDGGSDWGRIDDDWREEYESTPPRGVSYVAER